MGLIFVAVGGPRYPIERLAFKAKTDDLHVLAQRLDLTHQTVRAAAVHGLTDIQADRWAVRIGLHPSAVWGDLWWDNAPVELKPAS